MDGASARSNVIWFFPCRFDAFERTDHYPAINGSTIASVIHNRYNNRTWNLVCNLVLIL